MDIADLEKLIAKLEKWMEKIEARVHTVEKLVWTAAGGVGIIGVIVYFGFDYLKKHI